MSGKVYLVGAGPGDPGLITVKGAKILQQAEVVIYDYLVDKTLLQYAGPKAELICADAGGKKRFADGFGDRQEWINRIMVKKARQGKKVVRLKNGDPTIFGRLSEEMEALNREKINFSLVPGVSAINAAAAYTGIPLTSRNISASVTLVTGHEILNKKQGMVDWQKMAQSPTLVIYMGVENLNKIIAGLIKFGKKEDTPVAVISQASKIGQRTVIGKLEDIAKKVKEEQIPAPAMVIVGEVVKKERNFNWFRKSKKVLFTGLSPERFFGRDEELIFHLPLIEIKPLEDYTLLDDHLKKINTFDWLVFSSRFGVFYFFQRLSKLKMDSRDLSGIKIAAVGSSTANKLKEFGLTADLVPPQESSSGLIRKFKGLNISGKRILLLRSALADKGLTRGLKERGAGVYPCITYANVRPDDLPDLNLNDFAKIIFTSPSTVRNFLKQYGRPPARVKIETIGPVTKKEARKWNLAV